MMKHILIAVLGVGVAALAAHGEDLVAQTQYGPVRGVLETNEYGVQFVSFKGIPYAKQPLGKLRFKELQPADSWKEVYNATTEGPVCPQKDVFYFGLLNPQGMAEDCIHVNVYVPMATFSSRAGGKLPVLVYINGGGFGFGSSDSDIHGAEYLMSDKDVILVTFNYRIGPFGFLSLNSSVIPGNNGLRDSLTLLRWVKKNARAFGGNPDDVTIGGQSVGGSIAHLLTLSKESVGLFNRAILLSGTATRPFYSSSPAYAASIANSFLTGLGINSTDPVEIHDLLIQKPIKEIMDVYTALQDQTGILIFVPVIETAFVGVPTIIDDDPERLLLSGRGSKIPLIIGMTNVECESFRPRFQQFGILSKIEADKKVMVPGDLLFSLNATRQSEVADMVYKRYLGEDASFDRFIHTAIIIYKYCHFAFFQYPSIKLAQWRAEQGGAPVYMYMHEYSAERSVMQETRNITWTGSAHMEDQTYFLRTNHVLAGTNLENTDAGMQARMTTIVANFVKRGNPNSKQIGVWRPVGRQSFTYQKINNPYISESANLSAQQKEDIAFWDSLRE